LYKHKLNILSSQRKVFQDKRAAFSVVLGIADNSLKNSPTHKQSTSSKANSKAEYENIKALVTFKKMIEELKSVTTKKFRLTPKTDSRMELMVPIDAINTIKHATLSLGRSQLFFSLLSPLLSFVLCSFSCFLFLFLF
jgi:hypothetical protein